MSALASGDRLDPRFSLIRPLGRGGMAEVWLVRDHELDVEVAAKIVPEGASSETIDLLRRECQNTRRLSHPHIVRVFDFHRGKERGFITMDFVEGEDLGTLRGGDPREILGALIPVADALGAAHELGVVHRDLKTDNVLRDGAGKPHVLDFGIAAVLAGDDGIEVAGSGSRHGMSPQQLDGDEPRASDDIYAFGALLYELLSGHPPLWPEITDERIRNTVPDEVRSSHPLPSRLRALAARLLAKRRSERPREMAEVQAELIEILAELEATPAVRLTPPPRAAVVRPVEPRPVAAGSNGAPIQAVADPQRRQKLIAGAVVAPLALVAILVFLFLPGWVERQRASEGATATSDSQIEETRDSTTDAVDLAEPAPAREPLSPPDGAAARDALQRATEFRDRLQERSVNVWAPEEFGAALELLERADRQLALGAYAEAEQDYDEAIRRFEAIAGSGPEILREALERGRLALAAGDAGGAAEAFMLALTLEPGSNAAASGLKRAEVLDEVMALLVDGAISEREGRAREAEQSYRQAVGLDPMSSEAQQALARVQSRISSDAFSGVMSAGLEALERGDHIAAREAFLRAEQDCASCLVVLSKLAGFA